MSIPSVRYLSRYAHCLILVLFAHLCGAITTQVVSDDSFANFTEGITTGIEVLENGKLAWGNTLEVTDRTTASITWDLIPGDSVSTAWMATGKDSKIWKLTNNKLECVLDLNEEQPISLLWHPKKKVLLIGTGPEGNIYELDEKNSTATLWYATQHKYVWDMIVGSDSDVYAATGTDGCIFRISGKDTGTTFSQLNDVKNVMTLAFKAVNDGSRLIAGTQDKANVVEFDSTGKPFVLYSSKENEIRAITADRTGNIFAAVNSIGSTPPQAIVSPSITQNPSPSLAILSSSSSIITSLNSSIQSASQATIGKGNSSLMMISPKRFVQKLWSSNDSTINDLLANESFDGVFVACNKKDFLYKIGTDKQVRRIGQAQDESIAKLASSVNNDLLFATSNKASIGRIVSNPQIDTVSFRSRVISVSQSVFWGNVEINTEHPLGNSQNIKVELRTGNTNDPENGGWSDWKELKKSNSNAQSKLLYTTNRPVAQYTQYRLSLYNNNRNGVFPLIDKVSLYYIQINDAPRISDISFPKSGQSSAASAAAAIAATIASKSQGEIVKIATSNDKPAESQTKPAANATDSVTVSPVKLGTTFDVAWNASDANGDKLRYAIAYKADDESDWREIDEFLTDNKVSLTTDFLPDGTYVFKVDAFDDPANPADIALSSTLISKSVVYDRTPPVISALQATQSRTRSWTITADVTDKLSNIVKFEVNTDDRELPQIVLPQDGLFDSREEAFSFNVQATDKFQGEEYVVTFKAIDASGNQSVEKLVLKIKR